MPEEDRATATDNMRVVPEISSWTDRQTNTQTYSSQYFATAPAGKVKRRNRKTVQDGNNHCIVYLPMCSLLTNVL